MPCHRPTLWILALVGGLGLTGCYDGLPEEVAVVEASEAAPTTPLAELLYAGELGPVAARQGDRVRVMIWLRRLNLSASALAGLRETSLQLLADDRVLAAKMTGLSVLEAAQLGPLYTEMQTALAEGEPDEAALADWTERLATQQASVLSLGDPRALRQRYVDAVLDEADGFLVSLDTLQRSRAAEALFFLRRAVGPGATPDTWDALLGDPWPAGDFSTLRRAASPEAASALDVRALWTLDAGETDLLEGMDPAGLQAIVALALLHPELAPACDLLLGTPPEEDDEEDEDAPL